MFLNVFPLTKLMPPVNARAPPPPCTAELLANNEDEMFVTVSVLLSPYTLKAPPLPALQSTCKVKHQESNQ